MGEGIPKPSFTSTYRTSQPQFIFSFPQTRVTLAFAHTHTEEDLSECHMHHLCLSCSQADQGSACPGMCHTTPLPHGLPRVHPHFLHFPLCQHQPLLEDRATALVQQGHMNHFPPWQSSLLCSSRTGTVLLLCSLSSTQRYRAGYRFLPL